MRFSRRAVQKIDFILGNLSQKDPQGNLYRRIGIVVVQHRAGCVVRSGQLKGFPRTHRRIPVGKYPGKHLFLPFRICREYRFKGRALIRDIIIRAVRKFIKTIGHSRYSVLCQAELKYIIMIRSVQPVS